MDKDSWVEKCREIVVEGYIERGKPRKTWDKIVCGSEQSKMEVFFQVNWSKPMPAREI